MTQQRFWRKTVAYAKSACPLPAAMLVGLLAAVPVIGTAAGTYMGSEGAAGTRSAAGNLGDAVGGALDDSLLTSRVKAALLKQSGTAGNAVTVETRAGRVVLSGVVRDRATASHIKRIAAKVDGVRSVESRMDVEKR